MTQHLHIEIFKSFRGRQFPTASAVIKDLHINLLSSIKFSVKLRFLLLLHFENRHYEDSSDYESNLHVEY